MRNHTKIRNMKQKNKRSERTLTSLLLVVMLTLGCICTGTVQARAAVKSSLAEQNMNRSSAASNTCSHKWVTEFGNVGHIEYTSYYVKCGCGEGPMSFNGFLRHRIETGCNYNWWGGGKKYGNSPIWLMDDYKVCSLCGKRKITKPKNLEKSYLGEFNKEKITVNSLEYKVTSLFPEKTVTLTCMNDNKRGDFTDYSTSFTVPDTVKKKIRIKYGNIRETETLKVTGIGSNAFKYISVKKLTLGTNIESIGKNAFKDSYVGNIVIKSTKLTPENVADKAFNGLSNKKTVITVPKSKLKEYKKLFKQKGFKGKVKAGTWKEKNDSDSPSAKTPDCVTELDPRLIEKIDILDKELVEWSKDVWIDLYKNSKDRDYAAKQIRGGVEGDISNTMAAIFAYMDDDIVLEVSNELGGSYTIKEFLEAYCKKDPRNDYKQIIVYAANLLRRNCLIFG